MKKKSLPLLSSVEIIDTGTEGQGIVRHEQLVVFVKGAVPGDICDVQLTRKKNKYAEGRVVKLVKPSEYRVKPFCKHFGVCGGCKWQSLDYNRQLFYKQKQVEDALKRIAAVPHPEPPPILPSSKTSFYRNKLEFTFSNKKWLDEQAFNHAKANREQQEPDSNRPLTDNNGISGALGFHIPGLFDKIVDIDDCRLQSDLSNKIRNGVKAFCFNNDYSFYDLRAQQGLMRNLVVRTTTTGELMVIVIFHDDDPQKREALLNFMMQEFREITSLMYVINPKRNDTYFDLPVHTYAGKDYLLEQMEDLQFRIGPKSFYQTNAEQAEQLYAVARRMADLKGHEVVYDLYTGTGTIACYVARRAGKVVGIEYVAEAIEDAKINAQINGITNTAFFSGDMKDVLNDSLVAEQGKPDVIITDPPRAGMHPDVVEKILSLLPQTIVYVSCNAATQARDIALMAQHYVIGEVQAVDMFPQTHHVESVVKLIRKNHA